MRELDSLLGLDPGTLTGQELLEHLEQWDSLAVVSFLGLLDDATGRTVPAAEVEACKSINDLLRIGGF